MVKEIVPSDNDVLLGRGTKHHLHPGNQRYNGTNATECDGHTRITYRYACVLSHTRFASLPLAFLELNRDRYMDATNPIDKKAIIIEIVDHIVMKNGRFLKRLVCKDKTKQWVALSSAKVHLKTAHAIQYRMRKKKGEGVLTAKISTNVLLKQQRAQGLVAPLQVLAPRIKHCSYSGCQRVAMECSPLCYYCYCCCWFQSVQSQAQPRQWLPRSAAPAEPLVSSLVENDDKCSLDANDSATHQVPQWTSGFAPILSCSAAHDDSWHEDERTSAVGILPPSGREVETDCVNYGTEAVSRGPWLDALLLPEEEEDPVDRIVSSFLRARTDSFVSLEEGQPSSDLSMAPGDIDDSASIDTTISDLNGAIDSDWLGSSLSLELDGFSGL
jgi:hypothetical protein